MLASPDSVHTAKWARGLASRGVQVSLMALQKPVTMDWNAVDGVRLLAPRFPVWASREGETSVSKAMYISGVPRVRHLVRTLRPDVVHAHYLSSYGFVGALSGVHPLLVSVWGTDIYANPDRSFLHRRLAEYTLGRADRISATSHVMAERTRQFTTKPVDVIPFGLDLSRFTPRFVDRAPFAPTDIVIGTVKTLRPNYGIEYLIEAFAKLRGRHPGAPLKLLIVGGGPQAAELKELAQRLQVDGHVHFTGSVPIEDVPDYQNMLDVYVALSDSESFGVAVIEAGACGKPVVVSDVGGLPEVVQNGITGFLVPKRDAAAAAEAIERLAFDADLRDQMGAAARAHVARHYDINHNLDQMIALYGDMSGER